MIPKIVLHTDHIVTWTKMDERAQIICRLFTQDAILESDLDF
jgi:hypothetical protein